MRAWRGVSVVVLSSSLAFGQADPGSVPRGAENAIRKDAPTAPAVTPPTIRVAADPVYPESQREAGQQAEVTLAIDIDVTGKVTHAEIRGAAQPGFDEAARAAALKLEFEPAKLPTGEPVAVRILYRFSFVLKEQPVPDIPPPAPKVSGTVLTASGDVPLGGATATLLQGNVPVQSVRTDERGAFTIDVPTAGNWSIAVSLQGYETFTASEQLEAGEAIEVRYRLFEVSSGLEVTVKGDKPPREVTKRTVTRREIQRIPGTNGDALRSIQSLPGVARPPGLAGILIIRGAGPQDSRTFVDGATVPLIYHFGGLSSVIPTELIDTIDFYPGNFSAQYGRALGGIVNAGLRSPKDDGYHGLLQVDLIDARALFEGPMPFLDNVTFAVAGRRSYVDAWLGPVLDAAGASVTQAPVYYDYQAIVEVKPRSTDSTRVSWYGSDDALKLLLNDPAPGEPALTGNLGLTTQFQRLVFETEHQLSTETEFRALLALGHDAIGFNFGPYYFVLDARSIDHRFELSRKFGESATLNLGTDVQTGVYEVSLRLPPAPRPGEPPNGPFSTKQPQTLVAEGKGLFPGAYAEFELTPHRRVRVVPGIRFDHANIGTGIDVSPRLSARYALIESPLRTSLKGGLGVFHQAPQFQEAIPPLGTEGLRSNRAIHYGLGVEQELSEQIEVNVEGFYKQLDRLVSPVETDFTGARAWGNTGTGYSVGSEVLLKYKPDERFFGWVAYTLSQTRRSEGPDQPERAPNYDQTHILTVLGSYKLGGGWEFGARFRLISGNLVTPNVCDPSSADCDPYRVNALFHAPSGVYTPLPSGSPNSERLPLYHQLDLRLDKRWTFQDWKLSAYLDVQNAYNNANSEAIAYNFNFTSRQYVSGLPIIPSLGIRADF